MVEESFVIKAEHGLHARPAAEFVKIATTYQSQIELRPSSTTAAANAKSVMSVMGLGLSQGERVTIRATGNDQNEAVEALRKFLSE